MELDIWLPKNNLAFEYQGLHHFHDTDHIFGRKKQHQRLLDCEKQEECSNSSIKVIAVPYWWDQTMASFLDILNDTVT